jgi:hypothetical protein
MAAGPELNNMKKCKKDANLISKTVLNHCETIRQKRDEISLGTAGT